MLKRTTQGFEVLAEPKHRSNAKLLFRVGACTVFATLLALLIAAGNDAALVVPAVIGSFAALMIGSGLYTWFTVPIAKFATDDKSIGGSIELPYADAVAVIVSKRSRVFRLELLAGRIGVELKNEIASIRRDLDAEFASNSTTPEAIEHIRDRLARHRAALSKAPRLYIAQTQKELSTWRAAEAIAKEINIPILDDTGRMCIEKTPFELDMPIIEQLGQVVAMPPRLTLSPPGVIISDDEDSMSLSWPARNTHFRSAILLGIVAASGMIGVLTSPVGSQRGGLMALTICSGTAAAFFVLAAYLMRPMYTAYMDSLLFKYARPSKKPEMIPISSLESLEHDSMRESDLNLITDSEILKLECRREDVAVFVRSAVMYRLGKLAAQRQADA